MKYICYLLFSLCCFQVAAQTKPANHTLYIEALGTCGSLSINYDRVFYRENKRLHFSSGAGVNIFNPYSEPVNLNSLYITALIGKNENFFETGLAGVLFTERQFINTDKLVIPYLLTGYRHQKKAGGLFFRSYLMFFYYPDKPIFNFNEFGFPLNSPYLGVSLGYTAPKKTALSGKNNIDFVYSIGVNLALLRTLNSYRYGTIGANSESKVEKMENIPGITNGLGIEVKKSDKFSIASGLFVSGYAMKLMETSNDFVAGAGSAATYTTSVSIYTLRLIALEMPFLFRFYPDNNFFIEGGPKYSVYLKQNPNPFDIANTDFGFEVNVGRKINFRNNAMSFSIGYSGNQRLILTHPPFQVSAITLKTGYSF